MVPSAAWYAQLRALGTRSRARAEQESQDGHHTLVGLEYPRHIERPAGGCHGGDAAGWDPTSQPPLEWLHGSRCPAWAISPLHFRALCARHAARCPAGHAERDCRDSHGGVRCDGRPCARQSGAHRSIPSVKTGVAGSSSHFPTRSPHLERYRSTEGCGNVALVLPEGTKNMTTDKRKQRSSRLATSRADELVYAIALAMARRQMRGIWGCQMPAGITCRPAAPMIFDALRTRAAV